MKRNKTLIASAVTAAAMFMAPAFAQQEGFVDVKIEGISAELATSLGVENDKLPETVKAPIGVAASVCEISASELAPRGGEASAECTAKTSSTALEQIVRAEVQEQPGERKGQSLTEESPATDMGTTSGPATDTTTSGSATDTTSSEPATDTTSSGASTDSSIGTTTDTGSTATDSTSTTESTTTTGSQSPGMGTGADHTPSGGTVSPDSPALDSGSSTGGVTTTPDAETKTDSEKKEESRGAR
jgi:hypothetical protein